MADQIALKLLNWVAGFGPAGGDQYNQARIDDVCDFLNSAAPSPVYLTPAELAFSVANMEQIWEAWEDLF